MVICAHLSCQNSNSDKHGDVSFHRFPTVGSKKLNVWLNYCGIENYSEGASYRLCSEHFSKEQFKVNRTTENIGWKSMKFLRPNAVPDIPYKKRALHETVSTEDEVSQKRQKTVRI